MRPPPRELAVQHSPYRKPQGCARLCLGLVVFHLPSIFPPSLFPFLPGLLIFIFQNRVWPSASPEMMFHSERGRGVSQVCPLRPGQKEAGFICEGLHSPGRERVSLMLRVKIRQVLCHDQDGSRCCGAGNLNYLGSFYFFLKTVDIKLGQGLRRHPKN